MGAEMRIMSGLLVLAIPFCGFERMDAQVVRGDVSVGGGTGTDQRGVHSSAVTIAPSVMIIPNAMFSAGVAGSATRYGAGAQALGGTGSLGARLPLGGALALAASGAGTWTTTSFNATYSSAELTPTLEATIGAVTLFGGVHAASGTSTLREASSVGGIFPSSAGTRDVRNTRTSFGPVFGGVVDVDRASGMKLGLREEHARIAGVGHTDRVATGTFGTDRYAVSASAGLRDAPDEQVGFGSVTATVALARAVSLQAAAGSYPSNRVTGTLGGNFASIGLSFRGLHRLDADVDAAVVRGVPPARIGYMRLAIKAPAAERVEIAGDWTEWTPVPVTRAEDGTWYSDVRLLPGEHRYAFRVDGKQWKVPEGVTSVDDGFGGRSALVTVR